MENRYLAVFNRVYNDTTSRDGFVEPPYRPAAEAAVQAVVEAVASAAGLARPAEAELFYERYGFDWSRPPTDQETV